jgi:murein DD-endopeptidase MepM/ murein hydrolase activator NlpD
MKIRPLCSVPVVAAMLAIACGTPSAPSQSSADAHDVLLAPDTTEIRGVVPRNTTLDTMLRAQGLAGEAVQRVIGATRSVFDPRRLRSAQPFSLVRTLEGALRVFEYEIDADRFLRVTRFGPAPDAVRAEVLPIPKTLEEGTATGTIGGTTPSLFQAVQATGERPELAIAMAQVFSGEIDFNTELQPDDRFSVSFERFRREGRPDSYGFITAAEFHNDGRVLRAIRFTPPGGKADYFDEQGRSLQRFFLRSPLKFEPRITSGFSTSRMHPILHTERAHRGVDYAAPQGAPVIAIAAGTVMSTTTDRTNGRMVRLRHASGYESDYLHLSAFAPGLRAGVRVAQGELIGLVGSTGLATGPHLHYALKKNGTFVNPIREQRSLPPGEPVPASAMDAFRQTRDHALAQLARRSADSLTASR